ncbi:hypothetical protein KY320_02430 [Candidatus Woesearchaeota archaeon]|nr:hypothetical protein [Candidatus Woesearchaeota archaeon]
MERRFLIGIIFIVGFFSISLVLFSYINFFQEPEAKASIQFPTEEQPAALDTSVEQEQQAPREPVTHFINLFEDRAEPNKLTIYTGDTVVWLNKGSNRRRFWINEKIYSDLMDPTQSYSYTFEKAGSYKFRDVFNGLVVGTIEVESDSEEESAITAVTGNLLQGIPRRYIDVLALQMSLLIVGLVLLFFPDRKK